MSIENIANIDPIEPLQINEIHNQDNNDDLNFFTAEVFAAIDHIKNIWHKSPDLDAIYNYISKSTATNINRNSIENVIHALIESNLLAVKTNSNGKRSYLPTRKVIETDINNTTQLDSPQKEKYSNSFNPTPDESIFLPNVNETPICFDSCNKNDSNDGPCDVSISEVESQRSFMKRYIDVEISKLHSKVDSLSGKLTKSISCLESNSNDKVSYLREKCSFMEKELASKDKIIVSLLEAQASMLNMFANTRSERILHEHLQEPSKSQSNLSNDRANQQQLPSQQKDAPTKDKKSNQQNIHQKVTHNPTTDKNKALSNNSNSFNNLDQSPKMLYIGNLPHNMNSKDLYDLFGLNSSPYLQKNCVINLNSSEVNDIKKSYAYLTAPTHVCNEIIKFNGLELEGKHMIIETAKKSIPKHQRARISNQTAPPKQIHTNQLHTGPAQSQYGSYKDAVFPSSKNVALFCDSIPIGMRMKELNKHINGGRLHLKAISGAKANQLNRHVMTFLDDDEYDSAIIHVGVNDIIKCKNKSEEIKNLPNDILGIAKTCQNYNIGKIFISSILPTTRSDINISQINESLKNLCMVNNFQFIEHAQITSNFLGKDGLHLLDSGKSILGSNFVNCIDSYINRSLNDVICHQELT